MKQRTIYSIMVAGGVVGVVAAFLQTLEKLVLLQNKDAVLPCNFNSVFNCSTVLNAWQSSVFGFPNSIMCMALFVIFATTAFVGAVGGTLPGKLRLSIQALVLFTLGFALWFLWQSTFEIGALCIFCIFCFGGLLLLNWGWLRLNASILPIGERGREFVQKVIVAGWDTLAWAALGALVGLTMAARFML
ncbi:MAG TPA: vitamin K epoxide reductase family protein [Candidatus Saccharimonadales bacterium]|nr:vitamin K epoxide reductase family protein [Candidatus Saccharimonadales bacterium]